MDERPSASLAFAHVLRLISLKRSNIRIFNDDGGSVSLEKLRRLADEESMQRLGAASAGREDRCSRCIRPQKAPRLWGAGQVSCPWEDRTFRGITETVFSTP